MRINCFADICNARYGKCFNLSEFRRRDPTTLPFLRGQLHFRIDSRQIKHERINDDPDLAPVLDGLGMIELKELDHVTSMNSPVVHFRRRRIESEMLRHIVIARIHDHRPSHFILRPIVFFSRVTLTAAIVQVAICHSQLGKSWITLRTIVVDAIRVIEQRHCRIRLTTIHAEPRKFMLQNTLERPIGLIGPRSKTTLVPAFGVVEKRHLSYTPRILSISARAA